MIDASQLCQNMSGGGDAYGVCNTTPIKLSSLNKWVISLCRINWSRGDAERKESEKIAAFSNGKYEKSSTRIQMFWEKTKRGFLWSWLCCVHCAPHGSLHIVTQWPNYLLSSSIAESANERFCHSDVRLDLILDASRVFGSRFFWFRTGTR